MRRLEWSCGPKKASDLGLGGRLGLITTRASSLAPSSRSFESEDTDNCLRTRYSPLPPPPLHSKQKRQETGETLQLSSTRNKEIISNYGTYDAWNRCGKNSGKSGPIQVENPQSIPSTCSTQSQKVVITLIRVLFQLYRYVYSYNAPRSCWYFSPLYDDVILIGHYKYF